MIIVLAKVRLNEDTLEVGRDVLDTMVQSSRAEEGVLEYSFAIDRSDPTLMHAVEKYKDQEALTAHATSPHMAVFQKSIGDIGFKVEELVMFNADEGTRLM